MAEQVQLHLANTRLTSRLLPGGLTQVWFGANRGYVKKIDLVNNTFQAWIKDVAQRISNEVEGQHQQEYRHPGNDGKKRLLFKHWKRLLQHVAPSGGWRLDTDTYESQRGFGQYGVTHG